MNTQYFMYILILRLIFQYFYASGHQKLSTLILSLWLPLKMQLYYQSIIKSLTFCIKLSVYELSLIRHNFENYKYFSHCSQLYLWINSLINR